MIRCSIYRTERINWKWVNRREKRKFKCIEMCYWPKTKLPRTKDTRLLWNCLKDWIWLKTWESNTNLWCKNLLLLVERSRPKENTVRLTMSSRLVRKEKNYRERVTILMLKFSKVRKNLKLWTTRINTWKTVIPTSETATCRREVGRTTCNIRKLWKNSAKYKAKTFSKNNKNWRIYRKNSMRILKDSVMPERRVNSWKVRLRIIIMNTNRLWKI